MEEKTFLSEQNVVVTGARFIVPGQTYVIANVSSVSFNQAPSSGIGCGAVLVVLAILLAVGAVLSLASKSFEYGAGFGIGAILIGLLGVAIFRAKPSFAITLRTSGGEIKALESKDRDFIQRIVNALNEAIVARS